MIFFLFPGARFIEDPERLGHPTVATRLFRLCLVLRFKVALGARRSGGAGLAIYRFFCLAVGFGGLRGGLQRINSEDTLGARSAAAGASLPRSLQANPALRARRSLPCTRDAASPLALLRKHLSRLLPRFQPTIPPLELSGNTPFSL